MNSHGLVRLNACDALGSGPKKDWTIVEPTTYVLPSRAVQTAVRTGNALPCTSVKPHAGRQRISCASQQLERAVAPRPSPLAASVGDGGEAPSEPVDARAATLQR